jgi:hypothetical protein
MSRLSIQCRILNISQPYRPPRRVTGIALLFTYSVQVMSCFGRSISAWMKSYNVHCLCLVSLPHRLCVTCILSCLRVESLLCLGEFRRVYVFESWRRLQEPLANYQLSDTHKHGHRMIWTGTKWGPVYHSSSGNFLPLEPPSRSCLNKKWKDHDTSALIQMFIQQQSCKLLSSFCVAIRQQISCTSA